MGASPAPGQRPAPGDQPQLPARHDRPVLLPGKQDCAHCTVYKHLIQVIRPAAFHKRRKYDSLNFEFFYLLPTVCAVRVLQ